MGRSHSHRPSPQKIAQRERQAAYGASYRARQREKRDRERREREAAEQAAIYAPPAPQAPAPEPRSEELLRCGNCGSDRPASEYSPAAAARVRKGRRAWCNRCHQVRLQLLITPHGRRVA